MNQIKQIRNWLNESVEEPKTKVFFPNRNRLGKILGGLCITIFAIAMWIFYTLPLETTPYETIQHYHRLEPFNTIYVVLFGLFILLFILSAILLIYNSKLTKLQSE